MDPSSRTRAPMSLLPPLRRARARRRGVAPDEPHPSPRRAARLLAAALAVGALALPAAAGATVAVPARTDDTVAPRGVWPLRPRPDVVERFDAPDSRWGPGHRGVDLGGRVGQAVHAARPGTVTFAGRIAGRGVVVVDHGGTRTTYEPVRAAVGVGERVTAGAVLGRLTLPGSHCFPSACLHWGLIEGADGYRDPLTLVGAGPVRLLPLAGAAGAMGPARAPVAGLRRLTAGWGWTSASAPSPRFQTARGSRSANPVPSADRTPTLPVVGPGPAGCAPAPPMCG